MARSPSTFLAVAPSQRAETDRWRGSAAARGYGRAWQKARIAYLAKHPICACGCGRLATDLDHIIPHRGDMVRFWDRSNWQGLHRECHAAKTGRGA